jgi:hypothetical protein
MDVPSYTQCGCSIAKNCTGGVLEILPAKRLDHAPIPSHLEAFYPSSNMAVHKIPQNGGVNGKNMYH